MLGGILQYCWAPFQVSYGGTRLCCNDVTPHNYSVGSLLDYFTRIQLRGLQDGHSLKCVLCHIIDCCACPLEDSCARDMYFIAQRC